MKRIIQTTSRLLIKNMGRLLLIELLYKAAFFMVMFPLCRLALKLSLRASGFSYLTLENLPALLRGPVTILSLVLLIGLAGFFLMSECISLVIYGDSCGRGQKLPADRVFFPGLFRTLQLLRKKRNVPLLIHTLILSLFMILPLLAAILTQMRIPNYVLSAAFSNRLFVAAAVALLIAACLISYRGIFVLPFAVLRNCSFREACRLSGRLLKGRNRKILPVLGVWNLLLILFYFVLYYSVLFIAAGITYCFVDSGVVYLAFLKVYEQVSLYVGVFVAIVGMVANLGLFMVLYQKYQEENIPELKPVEALLERMEQFENRASSKQGGLLTRIKKPYRFFFTCLVVVVAGVNLGYLYDTIRNGSVLTQETLLGTFITAHRGASWDAPENTIPALEKAVEKMADYAEIDVRETKDGVVVLMHDANLRRTAGKNEQIWDVPYIELRGYDAGEWFSDSYQGTKIPTFSEVLTYCKGRINLNVEIKPGKKDQGLVDKVLRLIDQYDFEQQCVISSADYGVLARVKELKPEIKTGYILSLAYGNFYNSEHADFFSVKSSFINQNMVRLSHRLGKEIHAWTVNTRAELERVKQLGVDNIITDRPLLAREVLNQESEQVTFLGMFKRLLNRMTP